MTVLDFLAFTSQVLCINDGGNARDTTSTPPQHPATFCERVLSPETCQQMSNSFNNAYGSASKTFEGLKTQISDLPTDLRAGMNKYVLFPGYTSKVSFNAPEYAAGVFLATTGVCIILSIFVLASYYFASARGEKPLKSQGWSFSLFAVSAILALKMVAVMAYLDPLPINYIFFNFVGTDFPITFHHIMLVDVAIAISMLMVWIARMSLYYFNLLQTKKVIFFCNTIANLFAYGIIVKLLCMNPVTAGILPITVLMLSVLLFVLELGTRMAFSLKYIKKASGKGTESVKHTTARTVLDGYGTDVYLTKKLYDDIANDSGFGYHNFRAGQHY